MTNLNEKNFWGEISNVYPHSFKKFDEWLTRYKDDVLWHELFSLKKSPSRDIDFYDLPIEMQCGILSAFANQFKGYGILMLILFPGADSVDAIAIKVRSFFNELEIEIKHGKKRITL